MSNFDKVKYDNNYIKNNYDRLNIQVPKGQKAVIETHWKEKGFISLNAYVNELIRRDMGIEKTNNPTQHIEIKGGTVANIGNIKNQTINNQERI